MLGVTQDDINKYVENAKKKENTDDYKKYAPVSEKLINDVKDEIDLSGYTHALRDNDIRHILNSHGEQTNEKYPVTETDIEKIPYIVQHYDKVIVKSNSKGEPGLVYVKVEDENNIYYVEAVIQQYGNEKLLINKQMVKTGTETIPNLWGLIDAIKKEQTENEFLSDLNKIREAHARGEYHDQSVNNSIRQTSEKSQENISDGEKFSLRGSRFDELRYNPTMFAKRLINKFNLKGVDIDEWRYQ